MGKEKRKGAVSVELSLWSLLARSCFYKILAVLALMTAAEGAVFCWTLHGYGGNLPGFERVMDESGMRFIFLASMGVIFFILIYMEGMLERKSSCTLMRLRVSEWHLFWTKTAVNMLFLTVLFAVQIGVALWAARLYMQTAGPERVMPQFLFLAFYSNSFLHCLLPMADAGKWVRNGLMLLALSAEGGSARGKEYPLSAALFMAAARWFVSGIGDYGDIICFLVSGTCIAAAIGNVFKGIGEKRGD